MKTVLVKDIDDGVIVAKLESKVGTPNDGTVEIYKYEEYYHSLGDALRDIYGILNKDSLNEEEE